MVSAKPTAVSTPSISAFFDTDRGHFAGEAKDLKAIDSFSGLSETEKTRAKAAFGHAAGIVKDNDLSIGPLKNILYFGPEGQIAPPSRD